MSKRNSPPLEALLLPDVKPRKSWVPFIMGSILIGSFLLVIVVGCWGLIKLVESIDGPGRFVGGRGSGNWPPAQEKQAEYRASFQVPPPPIQDADAPQVEKLLRKYVTAAKYNDQGGLARLLDVDAFLARMQDHLDMPRLDATRRKALLADLNQNLQLPRDFVDFRLMGLKRLARTDWAVADVIFKQNAGTSEPCRFWLQQKDRAWSVIDWELIEYGKSEAAKRAGRERAVLDYLYSYPTFADQLRQADEKFRQGETRQAIGFVQAADALTIPGYVHKESQLTVARWFYRFGQHQEAINCLRTIDQPDEVPGYHVIRALCYEAAGQADKALEAAVRYEQLCGFSPDVVRAKGQALASLKKDAEALAEYKRLLDFDPTDQDALREYARLLPAGQKKQLAEIIARAKDPPAMALAVATFQLLEDQEITAAIRALLEKNHGGAPGTHNFVARIHQHEGDYDQAAAAFRQAFSASTEPGEKTRCWHAYVTAMNTAGKLLEGYEESKDHAEVFEYLTDDIERDESVVSLRELPPLLEAHRRHAPDDPLLHFCEGFLHESRGELDEAEQAYAAGEKAAADDSDAKERLQYARLEALADQGRILDAYRDYEKLDNAFAILARRCVAQHRPRVLDELIRQYEAGRQADPQAKPDTELEYYRIAYNGERQAFQQALQLLDQLKAKGGLDPSMDRRLLTLKADLLSRYDGWQSWLQTDPRFEETFPALAEKLEEKESWDNLRELLTMQENRDSENPQLLLYSLKLAWHLEDYGRIESLVPRWDGPRWAGIPDYQQTWAREIVVRSLLRQGKTSGAYAFAEQFQRDFQEDFPLLMVRIAQGDVRGLPELIKGEQHRLDALEQDRELLPLLTDGQLASLRRETPLSLPDGHARASLVLFRKQPLELDEKRVRELLGDEPGLQIKVLPEVHGRWRTLAIGHEGGTIFVTSNNSPYPLLPEDSSTIRREGLGGAAGGPNPADDFFQHRAWLAVELADSPAAMRAPRLDSLARRLIQKLCDDQLVGVALDEPSRPTLLLPGSQVPPALVVPRRTWREAFSQGGQVWLSLASRFDDDDELVQVRGKSHRQLAAAVGKLAPGQVIQIKVRIQLGHAAEDVWLKVRSLDNTSYGGYYLNCELTSDSQLYPLWKAGDLCRVSQWQVQAMKLPE